MRKIKRIGDLERKYVNKVLDGGFSSSNTYKTVTELEKRFAKKFNSKYAVAFANGTATLHTALEALGVFEGDEVIVPPLTMSSTAMAVLQANAIPVFADVDKETMVISPDSITENITKRTKAIIVVSLYGMPPDMDEIMDIARKHNLYVIEDDAQCFLGKYKSKVMGSIGHISSFSFQSSKHMTCGEGGMLTTDDEQLAVKIRRFSGLGYAGIGNKKGRITKEDIQDPDYDRHMIMGYNYRMSDICAAVALGQLERLEDLVYFRKQSAKILNEAVKHSKLLTPQKQPEYCESSYWAYVAYLNDDVSWHQFRDKFIQYGGDGVYAAWKLTYNEPFFANMTLSGREKYITKYKEYDYGKGICPNAEYLQPRLLQFKTNYFDLDEVKKQADILNKTVNFFK